jgi:hypothetical protein
MGNSWQQAFSATVGIAPMVKSLSEINNETRESSSKSDEIAFDITFFANPDVRNP